MRDIATGATGHHHGSIHTSTTRQRLRHAMRTWNRMLDAGVERRYPLPPVRDYPYPTT